MGILDIVIQKIKEEISTDPLNIGYAGKSDEEITLLLNSPVKRIVTTEEQDQPPVNRILSGVAEAANQVTIDDVKSATSLLPK